MIVMDKFMLLFLWTTGFLQVFFAQGKEEKKKLEKREKKEKEEEEERLRPFMTWVWDLLNVNQ